MPSKLPYTGIDYLNQNFGILDLTITKKIINHTEKKHFRNEAEYILVTAGEGQLEINGTSFRVGHGSLISLMPYHVHRFILTDTEALHVYHVRASFGLLLLTATNKETYTKSIKNLDTALPLAELDAEACRKLMTHLELFVEERNIIQTGLDTFNIACVSILSFYFSRYLNYQKKNITENIQWQVLQYIHFYHQQPLTISKVSQAIGITPDEVRTLVKQATGFGFAQVLNQVRIRNAAALTQFSDLSASQIGAICGYRNDASFYKQFKKVYEITPDMYRKNQTTSTIFGSVDAWNILFYSFENIGCIHSTAGMAKKLNLSLSRVETVIQDSFNISYQQLLTQIRIEIAHNLLTIGSTSMSELADKLGFSSNRSLVDNYRKFYGRTPLQERSKPNVLPSRQTPL